MKELSHVAWMLSDCIITNAILYIYLSKSIFFFFKLVVNGSLDFQPFFLGHVLHWTEWSTPAWSFPPTAGQSLSCSLFSGPGAHKAVPHTFSSLPLGVFALFKHFHSCCYLASWAYGYPCCGAAGASRVQHGASPHGCHPCSPPLKPWHLNPLQIWLVSLKWYSVAF